MAENIVRLVEKFDRNFDDYKHPKYNEASVRVDFVNPFWEALGWDVYNKPGYAPMYRDVVHEDEVRVGASTKAPDYSFRIGGTRIFFLETKKPAIDLKHDPAPAYQLRRYAYSAKLPVSLLTDFEEFIVYDTTLKPAISDKPHVGRMLYLNFREYPEQWEFLQSVFSKEAVKRGDFARFIKDKQGKKPRAEIDRDFLNDLDNWRVLLARNIALRNPQLSGRELNYAVQMTIDRLIFLRMSEDRGIEAPCTLQSLQNGERVYQRLVEIYYRADERYNSGLFHFSEKDGANPDTVTPGLSIDDKLLKEIVKNLYYPDCPYEFSVLPVEVLGNAYEQFLGKRISLTAGHHARIEEKPEVRKAGGVYYTPRYIVDYIVQNTVGKLLESKTPQEVGKLRILDPACGSGSFLLGAYQVLMDWHLDYYRKAIENGGKVPQIQLQTGKRGRKTAVQAIFQGSGDDWFLSTTEKKRILLNNLYGVDIDANAVEVTKLSLLLKVLENENSETLSHQLGLWHERALPNLGSNIKCGNSLIGPDYYDDRQVKLFDEEEALRVNVFDWEKEFPEIFCPRITRKDTKEKYDNESCGFDAVIGNPPYVRQEMISEFKTYFQRKYQVYHGVADLYVYFIEKAVSLLNQDGHFSYIVANKWIRANYGKALRQWLKEQNITEIIDFGDLPVFKGVTTYPCILKIVKQNPSDSFNVVQVDTLDFTDLHDYLTSRRYVVDQTRLDTSGWSLTGKDAQALLDKLKAKGVPLGEYVEGKIYRGVLTGLNEAFVITPEKRDELIAADPKSEELIKPFLAGKDIKRYCAFNPNKFIILIPKGWTNTKTHFSKSPWDWFQAEYPSIAFHLASYQKKAEKRWDKGEYWWELRACDYYDEFEKGKIFLPDISIRGNFSMDGTGGFYCANTCYIICNTEKYLLGILNSRLFTFFYKNITAVFRGGYLRFFTQYLNTLPILKIDFDNPSDKAQHDRMVTFVEQMLDLLKQLAATREPHSREQIQRRIDATDKQIDRLVYELYDLTPAEIRIVERNS